MSQYSFFVTPEEFDGVVDLFRHGTNLRFWRFPEGIQDGPVIELPDAVSRPVRLGELPPEKTTWNQRDASIRGFVALERPISVPNDRILCEGRIYSVESHAPFRALKRRLQEVAIHSLDVVADIPPFSRNTVGHKASDGALELLNSGWLLRQAPHFRSHFEPRP